MNRTFVVRVVSSLLLVGSGAAVQAADGPRRVGCFTVAPMETIAVRTCNTVRGSLRDSGWKDNELFFVTAFQWPGGPLNKAMAETARGRFDVIVVTDSSLVEGIRAINERMPIVVAGVAPNHKDRGTPFEKPGPYVAGVSYFPAPGATAQAFAVFRKIKPRAERVGILFDSSDRILTGEIRAMWDAAAKAAGFATKWLAATGEAADFDRAMKAMRGQVDGVLIGSVSIGGSPAMAEASVRHGIPVIAHFKIYDTSGNVASGPLAILTFDRQSMQRQAGRIADRILRGANAMNLSVEGWTDPHLIVDMKVARALGIELPQDLLATAERIQ